MTSSTIRLYARTEGENMSPALERILTLSVSRPPRLEPAEATPPRALHARREEVLNVFVIFTSVNATLHALKEAGNLADQLNGRIMLVAPQVVPYPLPLTSPPVLLDWNERRLRVIANQSAVETIVRIYLCRDRWQALEHVLGPHSVVVVGGRKRWWPTREGRLARRLRRAGHEVILTKTE
jgi:hypothetical protein